MIISANSDFSSPYPLPWKWDSISFKGSPVRAEWMLRRLVTPNFSGEAMISVPESVTAEAIFF